MSGIKLGDYTFDSRRVLYLASLKACVIGDFVEACGGRSGRLSPEDRVHTIERLHAQFERWSEVYRPEVLIIIGEVNEADFAADSPERTLTKLWASQGARLIFIATKPPRETVETLEKLGCEVHQSLIWGRYRFECGEEDLVPVDSKFITVSAHPNYSIKFASGVLRSRSLGVFLKGFAHILVPSLSSNGDAKSVFRSSLARYDVFAVGHQRILPLGKVADLRARRGLLTGLKLTVSGVSRNKDKGGTSWKKTGLANRTN